MFIRNRLKQALRSFKIDSDNDENSQETEQTTWCNFNFPLQKMLKFAEISVQAFIKMTTKLSEMLEVPRELLERLPGLESNFNVSSVLFSKYKIMFKDLFDCSSSHHTILTDWDQRQMYSKSKSIESNETLFEFGWLLFIYIKSKLFVFFYKFKN
jgi:hypothetical protein